MTHSLLIENARRFDESPGDPPVDVAVVDGKIESIAPSIGAERFSNVLDAAGHVVAPGFIDLHIHGGGGADSMDGTREAMATVSRTLASLGTTGFLATTFAHPESNHRHLETLSACSEASLPGAAVLGIHIEGPFINVRRKGGIPAAHIYAPAEDALREILDATAGKLRMMTIAPEIDGCLPVIEQLADNGVIAAFGHSDAGYRGTLDGFSAGISHVTHLYNAMRGLHHRDAGPLLAIFESREISAQLIADGVHVGPEMIRWTANLLGIDRIACITDGMQGTGLPDGEYVFNDRPYESKNGTARYLDGTLIGTTLGMGRIAQRFMRYTARSLAETIKTVTEVPARILGLDHRKGTLAPGSDADLVLLDADLQAVATVVGGRLVYVNEQALDQTPATRRLAPR